MSLFEISALQLHLLVRRCRVLLLLVRRCNGGEEMQGVAAVDSAAVGNVSEPSVQVQEQTILTPTPQQQKYGNRSRRSECEFAKKADQLSPSTTQMKTC